MASRPLISIACVTFNAPDVLSAHLRGIELSDASIPFEYIVVDNASDDETTDLLHRSPSITKLTLNTNNNLWAAAVNQAYAQRSPSSQFFVLVNPDVLFLDGSWIARLLAALSSRPDIGAVGTRLNFHPRWPTFGALDGELLMIRVDSLSESRQDVLLDAEQFPWNGGAFDLGMALAGDGWRYRVVPPEVSRTIHLGGASRKWSLAHGVGERKNVRLSHEEIARRHGVRWVPVPSVPARVIRRLLAAGAITAPL